MKINYIPLLFSLFLGTACEVLDVEPTDKVPAEQVFTDRRGLEAAVAGTYNVLQSAALTQDYYILAGLAADNLYRNGSKVELRDIAFNQVRADNIALERIWNSAYDGINRANNVLANIDGIADVSQEVKNQYKGEMLFMRAHHHFNLARLFGGIPLRDQPVTSLELESLNAPRSTQEQAFSFAAQDLEEAVALLEPGTVATQVSKGAALALLARVRLYQQNWAAAEAASTEVLNLGYELVSGTSYGDLFDEAENTPELILAVDYVVSGLPNPLSDYLLPTADNPLGVVGRSEVAVTESLYNAYPASDLRRDPSVLKTNDGSLIFPAKYARPATPGDNLILLRLAEMYLILAEAKAQQDDATALDALNVIRDRAGLSDFTSTSKQEILDAIQLERRRELAFEGHRWFDLARTGRLQQVLQDKGTFDGDYQVLFPIPQAEIDANELISPTDQNPGY